MWSSSQPLEVSSTCVTSRVGPFCIYDYVHDSYDVGTYVRTRAAVFFLRTYVRGKHEPMVVRCSYIRTEYRSYVLGYHGPS